GILTSISPEALGGHGGMDRYIAVKARMFANRRSSDGAIVGVDQPSGEALAERISGPRVIPVSVERSLDHGLSAPEGILLDRQHGREMAKIDLRRLPALKGRHNWQNAAMSYGAARSLDLSPDEIMRGLESFPGLAHRTQESGRLGGVAFVNDSKATNA